MMATALLVALGFGVSAVAVLLCALLYALRELGRELDRAEDMADWIEELAEHIAALEGPSCEPGDEWKGG